jgi:hypothetical protein
MLTDSENKPALIGDKKKLAEKHFEAAQSRAATAAKTGVAILAALVLLWRSNIEPIVPEFQAAALSADFSDDFKRQLRSNLAKKPASVQEPADAKARSRAKAGLDTAQSELAESLKKTVVPFKVPGFEAFTVPAKQAALVFNMLFFGVMLYLMAARTESQVLWARGTRLAREANGSLTRPDLVLLMPWWTAPLPARKGADVPPSEILALSGWGGRHRVYAFSMALALAALCAVQLRVCHISLLGAYAFSGLEQHKGAYWGAAASVIITTLTFACAIVWLMPKRVPDRLFDEPPPDETRRSALTFIAATFGFAVIAAGTAVNYSRLLYQTPRRPRFRRTKRAPEAFIDLPAGFYVNQRSKAIHYMAAGVSPRAAVAGMQPGKPTAPASKVLGLRAAPSRQPKARNFIPAAGLVDMGKKGDGGFSSSSRSYVVETAAKDLYAAGRAEEALELLQGQIHNDLTSKKPAMHLYYLLARYSIKVDGGKQLQTMLDMLKVRNRQEQFASAVRSWTHPESRWRRRLKYVA